MINVIGFKRIIILFVLISVNGALAGMVYLYTLPETVKADREYRSLKTRVNSAQSDLGRMQIEFEQLEQQQDRFDALKNDGFFSTQVRNEAKELFSKIQEESQVISAVGSVKSGRIENNNEAHKVGYKLLTSAVEVEIKAFSDSDIYRYLSLAEKYFPGHLSVNEIKITRQRDISKVLLRAIASGASPEIVRARVKMSWRTLIPEDQVILEREAQ